jgi:hypothetical protein
MLPDRTLAANMKDIGVTVFAGLGGVAAHFLASLKDETLLYGNIAAFVTAMFVLIRVIKLLIDVYYEADSRAIKDQRSDLEAAHKALNEEKARLDQESERLKRALSGKTMAKLLELSDDEKRDR